MSKTVSALRSEGKSLLSDSASARLEADLLLAHTLAVDSMSLLLYPDREVPPAECNYFLELIARRRRHEPIAYILGRKEFYSREFVVNSAVLVPRPETEQLVEHALRYFAADTTAYTVVDVGTGSGNIILTIALELAKHYGAEYLTRGSFFAIDLSCSALAVARRNAEQLGVTAITFIEGSILESLPAIPSETALRVTVSNPPYISSTEILSPDVTDFEPPSALFAGHKGMDVISPLVHQWLMLSPRAAKEVLLFEIGHQQESDVESLLQNVGLSKYLITKDFQGIPRVTEVEIPASRVEF